MITVVGLNHRTAPIELRERLHWPATEVPGVVNRVVDASADGAVLLSTCNRIEFYLTAGASSVVTEVWRVMSERLGEPAEPHAYLRQDRDAVRHLFRVAAGLDSMVLGESQIQGQVREAWESARGQAGPVLTRMFQMGLRVGGRVRSETQLGTGAASVPSASVELAKKIFGSLEGRRALILGSGDMAELAMGLLAAEGVEAAIVAHVNVEGARAVADRLGGRAIGYDDAWPRFADVDIVLCSTAAPHAIVLPERVAESIARRAGRPLCILDIAVPRDVHADVARFDNVFLYDIDDLQGVMQSGVRSRRQQIPDAERIVAQEVGFFWEWYQGRGVVQTIRSLRSKAERLRDDEVSRALAKLQHLPEADREQIVYLAKALTNKFLHDPTVRLRGSVGNGTEGQIIDAVRYLFDLRAAPSDREDDDRT